ncbi:MAG TPA: DUF2306 domain-containing protein [Candidatus Binatia bacterium]|nr:DUF2306 domain-containing protein [Candidatus Binatia bacterium]
MTDIAAPRAPSAPRLRLTGLDAAAAFWFAVMLIGQWIFVYYIAAFYGGATLSGDFAAWNEHPFVRGHVPGDTIGNLAFASHVMLAIVITFGGTLQLLPQIRARAAWLHRWNGRIFLVTSIAVSLAGFYMVWLREGATPEFHDLSISFNGALILLFAALAWRTAAARNITSHRRWALRTLMVVNGVYFIRLIFSGWILLTQSEPSTVTFYVFELASFLLPLAILELYLRARDGGGPVLRTIATAAVFGATAYMVIGTFAFTMIFVVGILSGAL